MLELTSTEAITALLETGEFHRFVGCEENDYLEAKRLESYDLSDPQGRYELAKDVSAFANRNGGYLALGLETEPSSSAKVDVVTRVRPFPREQFEPVRKAIEGVLKTHVYPRINDLDVQWKPCEVNPNLGLGLVFVPPQPEIQKYFLVTKLAEDGKALKQSLFGVYVRLGGDNTPLAADQLYRELKKGRSSQVEWQERIENKIDLLASGMTAHSQPRLLPVDALAHRLARLAAREPE